MITTTTSLSGFLKRAALKSVARIVDETFHSLYDATIVPICLFCLYLFPTPSCSLSISPSLHPFLPPSAPDTGARGGQVCDWFRPQRVQSRQRRDPPVDATRNCGGAHGVGVGVEEPVSAEDPNDP